MKRRFPSAAVLALALLAALPVAANPFRTVPEQEKILLSLLSAHEFRPSRKVLDQVGPDVEEALIHITTYPRVRPVIRVRAALSLAFYPTDVVRRYLLQLVHDPALKGRGFGVLMRRQALASLAIAFGDSVVPDLLGQRHDTDPHIREGVAIALGRAESKRAMPDLELWLVAEPEMFVKMAIDGAITQIRRAGRR